MTDWDTSQQAVFDLVEQRRPDPLLVYGAPGTGKSALAVELALRNLQDGYDSARLLLLSPSRLSAARLRDALEHQITVAGAQGHTLSVTEQPSKSFASYAFWLLAEARRLRIPGADEAPRLLS
ncbi:MAG: DNA/RNA helicase domain-containing protein, partial [Nesterenkonia sp.]